MQAHSYPDWKNCNERAYICPRDYSLYSLCIMAAFNSDLLLQEITLQRVFLIITIVYPDTMVASL